jgi:outer membrane protein OmpA-like peptidoglycan-associated protein
MSLRSIVFCLLFISSLIGGCATTPKLTQEQALAQSVQLTDLESRLNSAASDGIDYLSPEYFKKAQSQYDAALKMAMSHSTAAANQAASIGLEALDQAETFAQQSQEIFRDVLITRDRAVAADAPRLYPDKFKDVESVLLGATKLVEQGKLETAKSRRPELLKGYSDVELLALKKDTVSDAEKVLEKAKKVGVDDYAPKTFKLAQDELQVALSLLDANRQNRDKANQHAARSIWLAERGINITDLAKDFERRDFEREDMLLWYQQQLDEVNASLGVDLPFNEPNRHVIVALQNGITSLVKDNSTLNAQLDQTRNELDVEQQKQQQLIQMHQEEMAQLQQKYESQLGSEKQQQELTARQQKELQERFEFVQSLFDPAEARVFRQRNNVIIAAQGFAFPPGESEINAVNFPLLNKIVQSINKFPDSIIRVEGHTDSTGSAELNLALSKERASKVADFLVEVGEIDATRVTSEGFGKERPVASNETKEGRAANRRVEVQIINN